MEDAAEQHHITLKNFLKGGGSKSTINILFMIIMVLHVSCLLEMNLEKTSFRCVTVNLTISK
ncbi:hypothetical protein J2Y67_002502 [Neobacillus niacini]|nr:hypothetical protein [Neobacillus niacini]